MFEKVGRPGLPDLMKGKDTGLALQASWEFHKKLVKRPKKPDRGPDDTYAPAEMKKFVEFLKDRTKAPVPEWWQLAITDLSVNKGGGHMYFGFNQEPKPLEEIKLGGFSRYVKKGAKLTETNSHIKYTSGNFTAEIQKPTPPMDLTGGDCFIDVKTENATCVAAYVSFFARSFKCYGFDSKSAKCTWNADVWALAKDIHTGPSAKHRAELTAIGETVFVFGVEFGGLYVEAFDLASGKCQFRFCTRYWGNPSEEWKLEPRD